ncbi:MAG: heparinase II/III family protein [Spirochaetaceae bacterium]|nr:heparinase II/III family protein [Spirochaetaceae bacterium]
MPGTKTGIADAISGPGEGLAAMLVREEPPSTAGRRPGRGLLPEAVDSAVWERLAAHPFGRERLDELFAEAEEALRSPLLELSFHSYMRFFRDGDRAEYESAYFERRRRLELFALSALAIRGGASPSRGSSPGGPEPYLRALEELVWAICGEYSWCLPAHVAHPPRGPEGAGPSGPAAPPSDRFVDLFSAETAFALAEIIGLLGGELAPEAAERARREVLRRTVDGLTGGGHRYAWESASHNWAAVCAGGVGGAALWLVDDGECAAALLRRLAPALDAYLGGFPSDGACLEGMGYWTYGFGYFVAFAELLRERTGGGIDLLRSPVLIEKLREIALFPQRTRLVGEVALGFSDSLRPFRYPLGTVCRLAARLPGVLAPDFRLSETLRFDHCRRWAKHARDFAWFDPAVRSQEREEGGEPVAVVFPEAQWAIFRSAGSRPPFAFAAKGGNNDEPHNHNDVGSFQVSAADDILLDDFGAGLYDKGYFGPERYGYFVASSFGHSVPIVDGIGQEAGADRSCSRSRLLIGEEAGSRDMSCDFEISGAYRVPGLASLARRFRVCASPVPSAILEDGYAFSDEGEHEIRERFVGSRPARQEGDRAVLIAAASSRLVIAASEKPARMEFSERAYESHGEGTKTAYIVDFVYARSGAARLVFDIKIEGSIGGEA